MLFEIIKIMSEFNSQYFSTNFFKGKSVEKLNLFRAVSLQKCSLLISGDLFFKETKRGAEDL